MAGNSVFDSTKLLDEWAQHGRWPSIHDELIGLVHYAAAADASIIDLCCSTGILPQRIQDQLERRACGVEWLPESIEAGRAAGIDVPVLNTQIDRTTVAELFDWMTANEVTAVTARRCLSELAVPPKGPNGPPSTDEIDWDFGGILFGGFAELGVTDIWLQGRAPRKDAVHPVPDTATEVEWATRSEHFELHRMTKNCAWLKPT